MFCAPEETWWRGRKVSGRQRYGFPRCFRGIPRVKSDCFAWHWTTHAVIFGIYCLIWVDAGWLWNSKQKRQRLAVFPFFFFFLVHWGVGDIPLSLWIQPMLSPPLSVHAKTEISTILVLPGKYFLFTIKLSTGKVESSLQSFQMICQNLSCHDKYAADCFSSFSFFFNL